MVVDDSVCGIGGGNDDDDNDDYNDEGEMMEGGAQN